MKKLSIKRLVALLAAAMMLLTTAVPAFAFFAPAEAVIYDEITAPRSVNLSAPPCVEQKARGFCFAACLQSLDNMWGGSYTQNDPGINQSTGYVETNNSIVRWNEGEESYEGIKEAIDDDSYCLVYMVGKFSHWVVAYSATAASDDDIMVMDPYTGTTRTLADAMSTQSATYIAENRVAYKIN